MNILVRKELNMIRKIVKEVFKKAAEAHATSAKSTLSKYIVEKIEEKFNINISERTLIRSYDRYILSKKDSGSLTAENVDLLCKYLGYKNYLEYKIKNKTSSILKISIYSIIVIIVTLFITNSLKKSKNLTEQKNELANCMVWNETKYIAISCNFEFYGRNRRKVIPMDKKKLETMKKIKLKISDRIFTDTGEPLYWYYQNDSKHIDFFNTPGLHPINGKTLKKITKYIFKKHIGIHNDIENSFLDTK